jgi:hypothetical protein
MLHMFHIHVASVLSRCYICFKHMLQVFYLNVVYVATICFKCFIFVRRTLHPSSLCCKCFTGDTMSDGRTALAPGDGAAAS